MIHPSPDPYMFEVFQIGTGGITPFNSRELVCPCRTSSSDDSAICPRQKEYRNSRDVGCYRSNRLAKNSGFQLRWFQIPGWQTSQRSSTKNNQSLCKFTKRGGAEIIYLGPVEKTTRQVSLSEPNEHESKQTTDPEWCVVDGLVKNPN